MTISDLPNHLRALQTPCLLLRRDVFQANLANLANYCKAHNIALRPHAKTHKSAAIATEQIKQGAVGICCATLSEAEHLAHAVDDILITSPLSLPHHVARLKRLQSRVKTIACVVDSLTLIPEFERHFDGSQPLQVLLDLDPGMHRTGIEIGPQALELAHRLHRSPALELKGIQCYAGNLMHVESYGERAQRAHALWERVAAFKSTLAESGIACSVTTGGGTGTFDIDWQGGTATELQAGSYPFMDLEYMNIEWQASETLPFQPSLFVLTTVVSANTPGRATTDAGLKAFATDSVRPEISADMNVDASYRFLGDEHGAVVFNDGSDTLKTGTQLLILPPHCDPTINLYDQMSVVDESFNVIDTYHVDARSGKVFRSG